MTETIEIKVEPIHIVHPDDSLEKNRTEYGLLATGFSDYRFKSQREAERVAQAMERVIQKVVKA